MMADYEADRLVSVASPEVIENYRGSARATLLKDCRVNIRLSSTLLAGIRSRAAEEGLPYQSLIASILHKFVAGRLVEMRSEGSVAKDRSTRTRSGVARRR